MKALFIIVLCLLNTLLEAQNICLKGRLVDEHKNAVSSATVRCFIHDSVFVKGDISDSTGNVWKGPPFRWYLSLFKAVLPTIHYYILYRTSIFECCFRQKEA